MSSKVFVVDLRKYGHVMLVIIVLLSAYLSYIAYQQVGLWQERLARQNADNQIQGYVNSLERNVSLNIELLQGASSFFDADEAVTEAEFITYVKPLIRKHGEIKALEWIPRIAAVTREKFEQMVRSDGYADFAIVDHLADGSMQPSPERPVYFPVYYIEPRQGNDTAFGFDLGSNPARLVALDASVRSGQPMMTAPIKLVQEVGDSYGFLMIMPVYEQGLPHESLAERRRYHRGFTLGVYRVPDLMRSALPDTVFDNYQVNLRDITDQNNVSLMFTSGTTRYADKGLSRNLNLFGRVWQIEFIPFHGEYFRGSNYVGEVTLMAGLAFTLLIALFGLALLRHAIKIKESDRRRYLLLDAMHEGVFEMDVNCRCTFINSSALQMFGYSAEEAYGLDMSIVLSDQNKALRQESTEQCKLFGEFDGAASKRFENAIMFRKNTSSFPVSYTVTPVIQNGSAISTVVVVQDETATREMKRKISYQASHDLLTGLDNRYQFEEFLQEFYEDAHTDGNEHVLCYIDLDHFKVVNDTAGHTAGDELLIQVTNILKSKTRETDILSRIGGDEFALLLRNCSMSKADELCGLLVKAIHDHHFVWADIPFSIGVSIGIVAITTDSASITEILSQADIACYEAKEKGRGNIQVYRDDVVPSVALTKREIDWSRRIREALESDLFVLYCQKIQSLSDGSEHKIHMEVLLRMSDPEKGVVLPGEFILVAERYWLMPEIDKWVIRKVLSQCEVWKKQGNEMPEMISINLSGQSLSDKKMLEYIIDQLDSCEIDPALICFEITETAAIGNIVNSMRFISILRGMGCSFALDDFGSGLCSYAYLHELAVNILKIDGSLVHQVSSNSRQSALVASINTLAHSFDMKTVAEHVVNQETRDHLNSLGVNYVQGFYIEKPREFNVEAFTGH